MRLIVGITGATGSVYGIRLLQALRQTEVESHVIVSKWGLQTLLFETGYTLDQIRDLADVWHQAGDQGASVS